MNFDYLKEWTKNEEKLGWKLTTNLHLEEIL